MKGLGAMLLRITAKTHILDASCSNQSFRNPIGNSTYIVNRTYVYFLPCIEDDRPRLLCDQHVETPPSLPLQTEQHTTKRNTQLRAQESAKAKIDRFGHVPDLQRKVKAKANTLFLSCAIEWRHVFPLSPSHLDWS